MNEEEIKSIVHKVLQDQHERSNNNFDAVVLKTIATILTSFGINEDEKNEIRADFSHLRRSRKATERVTSMGIVTAVGILISGILGMLWLGFKAMVGK